MSGRRSDTETPVIFSIASARAAGGCSHRETVPLCTPRAFDRADTPPARDMASDIPGFRRVFMGAKVADFATQGKLKPAKVGCDIHTYAGLPGLLDNLHATASGETAMVLEASNEDVRQVVGNNLRRVRLLLELTQEQMAERYGLNGRATISKIEAGKHFPDLSFLWALYFRDHVDPAFLFFGRTDLLPRWMAEGLAEGKHPVGQAGMGRDLPVNGR